MKVHESALQHGVSAEDAVQAATWPLWIEELDLAVSKINGKLGTKPIVGTSAACLAVCSAAASRVSRPAVVAWTSMVCWAGYSIGAARPSV